MTIRIDGTNTTANPGITGADADTGLQFGTNEIELVTGGTNRATVESNGNFTIEDGNLVVAAGHGIDFSADANASGMTNELLDDYEEGTWTPTIGGTTTAGSYTYGENVGAYTKIGNQVTAHFNVSNIVIGTAGSGSLKIDGLPFTSQNTNSFYPHGSLRLSHLDIDDGTNSVACSTQNNTTELRVVETRDNASAATVQVTDIKDNDSADLIGSITYIVA